MPNFNTEVRADFSGGLNATDSPYMVGKNQVLRVSNMMMNEGDLRVRDGYHSIDAGITGALNLYELFNYSTAGWDQEQLAVLTTAGAGCFLYKRGSPWTILMDITNKSQAPLITHATFRGVVFFATGWGVIPRYYDGTVTGSISAQPGQTVPPGAQAIIAYLGRLWVWHTAIALSGSGLDGPSSLRWSDVATGISWPNSNQTHIDHGDGDFGTALGVFTTASDSISPEQRLFVFKNFATYEVLGAPGTASFTIQRLKTDMGCLALRSLKFIPGMGFIRLTHRGFALLDGLNDIVISDPITPYLHGAYDVTGILWENAHISTAEYIPNPPLYVCVCPTSLAPGLHRMFVLDLRRNTWTIFDYPLGITTINAVTNLALGDTSVRSGRKSILMALANDQKVYQAFSDDLTDNGAAIPWRVRFTPVAPQSPLRRAYYKRMNAKIYRVAQGQTITADMTLGPKQTAAFDGQRTMFQGIEVGATTSAGAPLSSMTEVDVSFPIGRTGEVQTVELSGSGRLNIRALEWQGSPKPTSRARLT